MLRVSPGTVEWHSVIEAGSFGGLNGVNGVNGVVPFSELLYAIAGLAQHCQEVAGPSQVTAANDEKYRLAFRVEPRFQCLHPGSIAPRDQRPIKFWRALEALFLVVRHCCRVAVAPGLDR